MKKGKLISKLSILILVLGVSFMPGSCVKDNCNKTIQYQVMTPVFKSVVDLRASFGTKPAMEINNPGKIYVYGKYLLVNELNKGIHIIDNSNPASPVNVSFINIPANVDMAVRNNVLFADCAIDLLAIDISDPANAILISRFENFYKNLNIYDPGQGVVVEYKSETKTETYSTCNPRTSIFEGGGVYMTDAKGAVSPVTASNTSGSNVGVGGSMAKFTIAGNYLYGVDNTSIYCVNISNPAQLSLQNTITSNEITESIFPYKDKLFIGGVSGMMIYSLSNPSHPVYESSFGHTTSCDPVVANDNYAFITLHEGTACHTHDAINELDVADITDIHNPVYVKVYPFTHPLGLGVDNNTLFLCDDQDGLKIFDATDPMTIKDHALAHFPVNGAYDVIPLNNNLILTAQDGIYQYDYSDLHNIHQVSKINVMHQ